jgi:hypothetical protein
VARNVKKYRAVVVASGIASVWICSGLAMEMVQARVADRPDASPAFRVKLNAPASMGMPLITALEGFSDMPGGS